MPSRPARKTVGKKALRKPRADSKGASAGKAAPSAGASQTREEVLKRMLINKKDELLREAQTEVSKYIKGENRQLVETALDDGDWSVIDVAEDINLRQLSSHRETIIKIDEALRKLRENTYGRCEECNEEINPERLRIMPFAIYCRDCQEEKERFEAATRETDLV